MARSDCGAREDPCDRDACGRRRYFEKLGEGLSRVGPATSSKWTGQSLTQAPRVFTAGWHTLEYRYHHDSRRPPAAAALPPDALQNVRMCRLFLITRNYILTHLSTNSTYQFVRWIVIAIAIASTISSDKELWVRRVMLNSYGIAFKLTRIAFSL